MHRSSAGPHLLESVADPRQAGDRGADVVGVAQVDKLDLAAPVRDLIEAALGVREGHVPIAVCGVEPDRGGGP